MKISLKKMLIKILFFQIQKLIVEQTLYKKIIIVIKKKHF